MSSECLPVGSSRLYCSCYYYYYLLLHCNFSVAIVLLWARGSKDPGILPMLYIKGVTGSGPLTRPNCRSFCKVPNVLFIGLPVSPLSTLLTPASYQRHYWYISKKQPYIKQSVKDDEEGETVIPIWSKRLNETGPQHDSLFFFFGRDEATTIKFLFVYYYYILIYFLQSFLLLTVGIRSRCLVSIEHDRSGGK